MNHVKKKLSNECNWSKQDRAAVLSELGTALRSFNEVSKQTASLPPHGASKLDQGKFKRAQRGIEMLREHLADPSGSLTTVRQ